jgi:hypothetical protein
MAVLTADDLPGMSETKRKVLDGLLAEADHTHCVIDRCLSVQFNYDIVVRANASETALKALRSGLKI